MNPECCGQEMVEEETVFINEQGEYEIMGYKCDICGRQINLKGEDV